MSRRDQEAVREAPQQQNFQNNNNPPTSLFSDTDSPNWDVNKHVFGTGWCFSASEDEAKSIDETLEKKSPNYYLDKVEAIEKLLREKEVRDASERGTPDDGRFYHEHTKASWQADFDNLRLRERLNVLFATVAPWSEDLKNELELIDEILDQQEEELNTSAPDLAYYSKDLYAAEEVILAHLPAGGGWTPKDEVLLSTINDLKLKFNDIINAQLNTPFNNRPNLKALDQVKIRASRFLNMVCIIYNVYDHGKEIGDLQYLLFRRLPPRMTVKINPFIQESLEDNEKEREINSGLKKIDGQELLQKIVNHFPEIPIILLKKAQETQEFDDWGIYLLNNLIHKVSQCLFQKESFTAVEAHLAPLIAAKNKINNSTLEHASKVELNEKLESIYSALQTKVTEVSEAKQASQLFEAGKVAKLHFNVVSILCDRNSKTEEKRKAIQNTYSQSISFFESLAEIFRALTMSIAEAFKISVTFKNPQAVVDYMSPVESDIGTDNQSAGTQSERDDSPQEKNYGPSSPRLFRPVTEAKKSMSFTEMKESMKDTALELLRAPKAS